MFTLTNILVCIILFLLGSIVGSFLNVVILRSEKDEEFVRTASHCDHCKEKLKPWENIPVFSYIFLRGKCSHCHKKISILNPFSEGIVGLLFVAIYVRFLFMPFFQASFMNPNMFVRLLGIIPIILWLMYTAILFLISVYDIRNLVVLDGFLVAGFFVGLIGEGLLYLINKYNPIIFLDFYHNILGSSSFFFPIIPGIFSNLLGLLIGYTFIKLIVWVSAGRAMGDGDPIIAGFIGFIVGTPAVFLFLFVSFLLGGVIGMILILIGKKRMKQYIAFGPYLALGGLMTFLFGEKMLWYYFHWMTLR